MQKLVAIGDFLEIRDIKEAVKLYLDDKDKFHDKCVDQIIKPNIERIEKGINGEVDPDYLAYALEFALMNCKMPYIEQ
jgi:hypothetical protein